MVSRIPPKPPVSQRPLTPQDMEALKRSREKLKGGSSSGSGPKRDMGPSSGRAPIPGGRGIVTGLPTPKKSAPREKVVLRDPKGQLIKDDRKPVLYSGSGMKRGGMVKGKK